MATKLSDEKVMDRWQTLMEGAAGRGKDVLIQVTKNLNKHKVPGVVWAEEAVKLKKLFSEQRSFLVVRNQGMKDHRMYIGARDYGADLSISWFLTAEPGYFKTMVSTAMTGSYAGLSYSLDLFAQEELTAYVTVVHHSLTDAVQQLMEELGQDFSKVNTKSKGFLEVW